MEIGTISVFQKAGYGDEVSDSQVYREDLNLALQAEPLGFDSVWCVEHHFRNGRSACPTPEAVLGGLALSTSNIRLGFGVVLMPFGFQHPARVAEKVRPSTVSATGGWNGAPGAPHPWSRRPLGSPPMTAPATLGARRSRSW